MSMPADGEPGCQPGVVGRLPARPSYRQAARVEPTIQPPTPRRYTGLMCRNIRTLFNFEPPATEEEIRAASLQFVRKLSGFTKPSKANEAAFATAVEEIAVIAGRLIDSLVTTAAPHDRDEWAAQARARAAQRYGTAP
jgi:hypothetical protein